MSNTKTKPARTPQTGSRPPGHDPVAGGLRFLSELIAWIAAPWALWPHSMFLAVGVVLLLIVPPAIFSTPGDRPGGDTPIAVTGFVTILMLLSHLVAATAAAWALWPTWIAIAVTGLCLLVVITEQPRWHALTRRNRL